MLVTPRWTTWALLGGVMIARCCATEGAARKQALVTDPSVVFSVPEVPRPSYLAPMVDPTFGTTITRIADDTGRPIVWSEPTAAAGTWSNDARHHYVDDQPWNSDGSLLVLENRGKPNIIFLDGRTYQPKFPLPRNYERGQDRWHPSPDHPHERINLKGSRLEWFDVVRGVQTRHWALPFPATNDIAGNPSRDGRFIVLTDTSEGSLTGRMFVVDMDPQPPYSPYPNRRIGPPRDLFSDTGLPNLSLDWAAISPSGRYAVVVYNRPANDFWRVYDVDPQTLALTPRALPKSYPGTSGAADKGFLYNLGHGDMTLNPFDHDEDAAAGQEHAKNAGRIVNGKPISWLLMVRLSDGEITPLSDPNNEAYPFHISARNFDRPGWVYVSYHPATGKRFGDEIVAVKLDGSKSVERLAHTHSNARGLYRAEPHAVPSPDGRHVIFASNWASSCGSTSGPKNDIKAYVIDTRRR